MLAAMSRYASGTDHFDPFPNKPWFLRVCSTNLLKTLPEKEKLLFTSNFSISHCVFYLFGELSAILANLKSWSANSLNLEESKICRLGKSSPCILALSNLKALTD